MTSRELAALFETERKRFARYFNRAARVEMQIETSRCVSPDHCAYRDFGYTDTRVVVLHHRILKASRNRAVGLIRHELGHVCDPTIWNPGAEQRADDIAELVSGEKIRYDHRDVQTVGRGAYPRPTYLPK